MSDFVFETTRRVICEFDGALQLGALCKEFGAKRAVLLTDPRFAEGRPDRRPLCRP